MLIPFHHSRQICRRLAVFILLKALPTLSFTAAGQSPSVAENSRSYEIRSNIAVYPCDVLGRRLYADDRFQVPPYKSDFAIVRNAPDNMVVIRFLSWRYGSGLYRSFNAPVRVRETTSPDIRKSFTVDTAIIPKYFLMRRGDLDSNCVHVYATGFSSSRFTIGLVTMPLKLRMGSNFSFHGNLSLGTTAGLKMRISRYNENYVNILFGASIGTTDLDSFNTKGKVIGQPLNNMAVFSPSLGIVWEFGKAQAGFFYGWDFLNKANQSRYHWIYQRKPWLSIGFGFSIFNVDSKTNDDKEGSQKTGNGSD